MDEQAEEIKELRQKIDEMTSIFKMAKRIEDLEMKLDRILASSGSQMRTKSE